MVKVITAETVIDSEHLLGKFIDERHFDVLIEEDTDFYSPPGLGEGNSEKNIVFKFRKNVFSKEEQLAAYENMHKAAISTENRGLASGTKDGAIMKGDGSLGREWITNYQKDIMDAVMNNRHARLYDNEYLDEVRAKYPTKEDRRKALGEDGKNNVWVISRFRGKFDFDEWVDTLYPMTDEERYASCLDVMSMISETTYGNNVLSGIAGSFSRYPRIPYGRHCAYNAANPERLKAANPFFATLSRKFEELLPERYKNQKEFVSKLDPEFVIENTVFTTLTINKTFRTAAHRDAGDLDSGFSNLTVVSNGKDYTGGYLILPEFRAAINIRPGDLLLVGNHDWIHGNTEIVLEEGGERVSFVAYAREDMQLCGTKKYEDCRHDFIEQRRTNPDHPMQRLRWNGVSPGWEKSQEWYDYLEAKLGRETLLKYHPEAAGVSTLEGFFA